MLIFFIFTEQFTRSVNGFTWLRTSKKLYHNEICRKIISAWVRLQAAIIPKHIVLVERSSLQIITKFILKTYFLLYPMVEQFSIVKKCEKYFMKRIYDNRITEFVI